MSAKQQLLNVQAAIQNAIDFVDIEQAKLDDYDESPEAEAIHLVEETLSEIAVEIRRVINKINH